MKKVALLIVVIILSLNTPLILAQSSCKVLKPEISGEYKGSCNNDLADGKGESIGLDRYAGEFKKGLPHGVGIYIWHTGETYSGEWAKGLRNGKGTLIIKLSGRDSTISGRWKDDKFIGEKEIKPYSIEYSNSIVRVSFMEIGERPYVKYVFSRNGTESHNISNLFLLGSSGAENSTNIFTGFEHVTFPFKGKVTFNAPNSFMVAVLSCELRFIINKPGSWVVTIFY